MEVETPTTDVTETPNLGASPDAADSSTVEGAGSQTQGASGDVQNPPALEQQASEQTIDPLETVLKDLPSVDELKQQAQAGTKYAAALAELRPVADKYREVTEQFTPWKPIVEQYTAPEELQSAIDWNSMVFGKTRFNENGEMVPDLREAAEFVASHAAHRADQLMAELLLTKVVVPKADGTTETIERLESLRRHMGWLRPDEVPVGAADQSDLANIKQEYREVFQKLAPETQEMLINGSEVAREQFLAEKLAESNRLASEAKANQEKEVQFFQEAQNAGYEAVVTGYGETLNSIVDDIFKDVSNDKVTLTGDQGNDTFLKGLVRGTLLSLTDPVKRPFAEADLGIKVPADLDKRVNDYEDALSRAIIAEKYGDNAAAKELRRQANGHAQWLRVKGHEIGAQALSNLSKILGFSYETQNNLLGQATRTRPVVTGTPLNPAHPNQAKFEIPEGVTPFSPEWNEITTRQFVRS